MKSADSHILDCFIDPQTKAPLTFNHIINVLESSDGYYAIKNRVIDLYTKISSQKKVPLGTDKYVTQNLVTEDFAPELRTAHDLDFQRTSETGGNIYGSLEELPAITQSGHYRRISILQDMELGFLEDKTVVDFGTGPWGFGAIFPKLRSAKCCIGFDVSLVALEMARSVEMSSDCNEKIIFATSDGDAIPLADNSVDLFFGGEVIEHVRNPKLFLQEIARVCRQDAIVILTTPNKDAIDYRLQSIQYCVGPEHIALLSFQQFQDLLCTFTDSVEIYGYETALGPNLDNVKIDDASCNLIQKRAYLFPELSTGMISFSTVCKKKFNANLIEWHLKEWLWSSDTFRFTTPPSSLHLFAGIYGALLTPENKAEMQTKASQVSFLFWGHDWSGEVEIITEEDTYIHDLYSLKGGFIRIELNIKSFSKTITIRPTGKKRDVSKSNQVILFKVIQYETIS